MEKVNIPENLQRPKPLREFSFIHTARRKCFASHPAEEKTMQTAHELFLHELSDMLDAERNILEALEQQAEECSRPELQKAFETHRQQT